MTTPGLTFWVIFAALTLARLSERRFGTPSLLGDLLSAALVWLLVSGRFGWLAAGVVSAALLGGLRIWRQSQRVP